MRRWSSSSVAVRALSFAAVAHAFSPTRTFTMASRYAAHPATRVEQAKEAGPKDGPNETIRAHLFCKPATDGVSVGDCPFTHYARMALAIAGMEYIETPLAPSDKPGWHLEEHGGSMPCWSPRGLYNGEGAISDSGAIAKMALPPTPADDAALGACGGLFLGIAKYLKNSDDARDGELKAGLDAELAKLEALLFAADGPFLAGAAPGVADCSVATKLYVLLVGAGHYKNYVLDAKYPNVARYYATASSHPAFYATRYPESEMLAGWGEARGGGH
jgi:hypothetical protein